MIIYYNKTDGEIIATMSSKAKEAMSEQDLQADAEAIYPGNAIGISIVADDADAEIHGTWDASAKRQTAPAPRPVKRDHPQKARAVAIRQKIKARTATIEELCELMDIASIGKTIAG